MIHYNIKHNVLFWLYLINLHFRYLDEGYEDYNKDKRKQKKQKKSMMSLMQGDDYLDANVAIDEGEVIRMQ